MSERVRQMTIPEAADVVSGKSALILCHVNPDGDALGSATALAELLRLTGGGGTVVTPSPVPERLRFLVGEADTAYVPGMESDYDMILAVDTASPSQLGELSFLAEKVDLSFDHHESCTPYSPYVLYPGESAAAKVIFDLLQELEARGAVTGDPAGVLRRVFAGIASDTGSFKYANSTPEAFSAAAEICRRLEAAPMSDGAPVDGMTASEISSALFDNVSRKDIEVRRLTYKNLRYICDGKLAVSLIDCEEMKEAGLAIDDLGGMVDCIRAIDGTVAGIALKYGGQGSWRGSSRSNCDFDVAAPSALLNGGGHKRAAGFRVKAKTAEEALQIIENIFGGALTEWEDGNG